MKNVIEKLKTLRFPSIKLHGKILTIAGSTLVGMAVIATIFFYQSARIEAASQQERMASVHVAELAKVQSAAESLSGSVQAFVVRPTEDGVARIEQNIQFTSDLISSGKIDDLFEPSLTQLVKIAEGIRTNQSLIGFNPSSGLGAEISDSISAPLQVFEELGKSGIPVSDVLSAIFSLREAERRFMLTKDTASVELFDSALKGFDTALETVYISSKQREGIDSSLLTYQETFGSFVSATNDVRAGMAALTERMSGLSESISGRHEVLNEAGKQALQLLENERISLKTALASTIVVVSALVFGLALVVGRSIEIPIKNLEQVMGEISKGEYNVDVPFKKRSDEVGEMARAVEVFRENGLKISSMSEEERIASERRHAERTAMMKALQLSFGEVVDAASEGDFSKSIEDEFPDPELNALAGGVNNLVETVERGLSETGQVLSALANTDLSKRVDGDYKGAFANLKDDTNAVGDKLTEIVASLRDTSGGLKSATGEILAGANDLSSRTTQQAATIEETAATMEVLASKVTENAALAQKGSENAQAVASSAEDGGAVMKQTTEAMKRISDSSGKISNIIGMIDDIAFQTNLLALNASVEAARAGDAGKGFAVVAIEVRRLAQSAASASSDVKELIERSVEDVENGSNLVASASEKLNSIQEAVHANNGLMSSIAQESRSQASSIDEVSSAVRQMDELTQANAALVEQTNAAIEQTEAQAHDLDEMVNIFKLRNQGSQTPQIASEARKSSAGYIGRAADQVKSASSKVAFKTSGSNAVEAEWLEF